jgi:hypothetical protein
MGNIDSENLKMDKCLAHKNHRDLGKSELKIAKFVSKMKMWPIAYHDDDHHRVQIGNFEVIRGCSAFFSSNSIIILYRTEYFST